MLSRLHVRNYVLIDSLEIDFPEGLVIITGQTGAGKSILLGALGLIMGAKADASMLSEDADNCVVEAEFSVGPDSGLKRILEDNFDGFSQLAELLLEKEVIFADDLERIFGPRAGADPEEKPEATREEVPSLEPDVIPSTDELSV